MKINFDKEDIELIKKITRKEVVRMLRLSEEERYKKIEEDENETK